MIGLAAADVACRELRRIVDQPADLGGVELRSCLVFLAPLDRFFRRIDVRHLRPGFGGDQRGSARVPEKIENARRLAFDFLQAARPSIASAALAPEKVRGARALRACNAS